MGIELLNQQIQQTISSYLIIGISIEFIYNNIPKICMLCKDNQINIHTAYYDNNNELIDDLKEIIRKQINISNEDDINNSIILFLCSLNEADFNEFIKNININTNKILHCYIVLYSTESTYNGITDIATCIMDTDINNSNPDTFIDKIYQARNKYISFGFNDSDIKINSIISHQIKNI